ncbi:hypothetical protein I41_37270 [Lacipirellula limnantheis]|uniref:Uncharacterized protein n=1 Tax=Lacipirellula limnantheis TaxID=2528024 RepID=A0A517U1N7_9BACT|nr:hypothetical protein I41_37270 [Lacipirellula limnantheis]
MRRALWRRAQTRRCGSLTRPRTNSPESSSAVGPRSRGEAHPSRRRSARVAGRVWWAEIADQVGAARVSCRPPGGLLSRGKGAARLARRPSTNQSLNRRLGPGWSARATPVTIITTKFAGHHVRKKPFRVGQARPSRHPSCQWPVKRCHRRSSFYFSRLRLTRPRKSRTSGKPSALTTSNAIRSARSDQSECHPPAA